VRAGAGLGPARDVAAVARGGVYVDFVTGEVPLRGLQGGQVSRAGGGSKFTGPFSCLLGGGWVGMDWGAR